MILFLWLILELCIRCFFPSIPTVSVEFRYHNDVIPHTAPDRRLGFGSRVLGDVSAILSDRWGTIASVRYRSDERGQRLTPRPFHVIPPEEFVIFSGCSFTFGSGVGESETLPAQFAIRSSRYHVYNWGFGGYGPQQVLLQLGSKWEEGVAESRGHHIYTFIDDHLRRIRRTSYSMLNNIRAGLEMPYFRLDRSGSLVSLGVFTQEHSVLGGLAKLVAHSEVARRIAAAVDSGHFSDADVELFVAMMIAARDRFERQGLGRFVVLIFPGSKMGERVEKELEGVGIAVLNYQSLFQNDDNRYWLRSYNHPNADGYKLVAARLSHDFKRLIADDKKTLATR